MMMLVLAISMISHNLTHNKKQTLVILMIKRAKLASKSFKVKLTALETSTKQSQYLSFPKIKPHSRKIKKAKTNLGILTRFLQ